MKSEKKRPRSSGLPKAKKIIIQFLHQEYKINDIHDIPNVLKNLLGDTIKGIMKIKMKEHFGNKNQHALTHQFP